MLDLKQVPVSSTVLEIQINSLVSKELSVDLWGGRDLDGKGTLKSGDLLWSVLSAGAVLTPRAPFPLGLGLLQIYFCAKWDWEVAFVSLLGVF